MAAAARVRWVHEELPDFGSPFSNHQDDSCDSDSSSTSSLAYVNSQLVAHGFTSSSGLSLNGVSTSDSERVVRCLLNLLGARVEDMSRTEELTTKLRTLSYDHERLLSMHRTATEKAANAEKEMNLHKTRMAATTRTLSSTITAHKHTAAELQRTRTLLQGVRATHVSELKKRDKDIERMSEKWGKIADAQVKVVGASSGLRFSGTGGLVDPSTDVYGKGQGFLEEALEQSEASRSAMGTENTRLRRALLRAVNEVQDVLHATGDVTDEPVPFTLTTLFPLAPTNRGYNKLEEVLFQLKERVAAFTNGTRKVASPTPQLAVSNEESERLQGVIIALKNELDLAQKSHIAQSQELLDQFAQKPRLPNLHTLREEANGAADISTDLLTGPDVDEEQTRLDSMKAQLNNERNRFTEATIKLGRERATMEAERIKFLEEKRSWQVEMMLADLPPTPIPSASRSSEAIPKAVAAVPAAPRSPRKSPRKMVVGRSSPGKNNGSGRKTRVSRRSSIGLGSPTSKARVEPAYETEVIKAPLFAVAPSTSSPPMASLLPTSFALPPSSPHSSLPKEPVVLSPVAVIASKPIHAPIPVVPKQPPPQQKTPPTRSFPMAFRLTHAYSPAKPSPLSRILMMANSPPSSPPRADSPPMSPPRRPRLSGDSSLGVLAEEDEEDGVFPPVRSLAAELGLSEPLQERSLSPNFGAPAAAAAAAATKRYTAAEKGKGRPTVTRVPEKENRAKVRAATVPPVTAAAPRVAARATAAAASAARVAVAPAAGGAAVKAPMPRTKVTAKLPPGRTRARRVLVDGWKG